MKSSSGVHLVGSVPLADATSVFTAACTHLETLVSRIPDGETGERTNWIGWQLPKLANAPGLSLQEDPTREYGTAGQIYITGSAEDVVLGNLGYRDAALASYSEFKALKQSGEIPADVRFQVCLPTPLAPIHLYVRAEDRSALEPIYEAALLEELEALARDIPHDELAVQWDTAVEFGVLEGVFPTYIEDTHPGIVDRLVSRLVRLGDAVPADIELGYHLCYGDAGHKHFVEPTDMAKLVAVANGVSERVSRDIQWIHMPVPREREDQAYFAPLADLAIGADTELYLGLLHMTDGKEGALKRLHAAQSITNNFGVATECGFGRRPAESIPTLLDLHREIAQTL